MTTKVFAKTEVHQLPPLKQIKYDEHFLWITQSVNELIFIPMKS